MSGDSGNTAFACAAGGADCTVVITVDADDGTVSAMSTGGMVTAGNSATYQAELDEAAEAAAAAIVAEAMRIAAAIGPWQHKTDTDGNNEDGITMPFTSDGTELAELPLSPENADDDFAMSEDSPATIDGWAGTMHTRDTMEDDADTMDADESIADRVVSYTNEMPATDEEYLDYYDSTIAGSRDAVSGATDGVLDIAEDDVAGNHALFMGDFGITAAHQTIPGPVNDDTTDDVDEGEVSIMGSFNGVPGTFACGTGCFRTSDGDGNLSGLGGTWTFTPAELEGDADPHMVAGVTRDEDYLTFGYWVRTTQGRRRGCVCRHRLRRRRAGLRQRHGCRRHGGVCRSGDRPLHAQEL